MHFTNVFAPPKLKSLTLHGGGQFMPRRVKDESYAGICWAVGPSFPLLAMGIFDFDFQIK